MGLFDLCLPYAADVDLDLCEFVCNSAEGLGAGTDLFRSGYWRLVRDLVGPG